MLLVSTWGTLSWQSAAPWGVLLAPTSVTVRGGRLHQVSRSASARNKTGWRPSYSSLLSYLTRCRPRERRPARGRRPPCPRVAVQEPDDPMRSQSSQSHHTCLMCHVTSQSHAHLSRQWTGVRCPIREAARDGAEEDGRDVSKNAREPGTVGTFLSQKDTK